jgi:hypothetical protein
MAGLDGAEGVLVALSQHARDTLQGMARHGSTLKVSPFCHETHEGAREVRGWVLEVPADAPASALPINCCLFDGVSLVECDCPEAEVLQLLSNADETRRRLGQAIEAIMTAQVGGDRWRLAVAF